MQGSLPLGRIFLHHSVGLEGHTACKGRMTAIVGWWKRGKIGLRAPDRRARRCLLDNAAATDVMFLSCSFLSCSDFALETHVTVEDGRLSSSSRRFGGAVDRRG